VRGCGALRGSRTVDPHQPWLEDAPAVARMREQGAILLGKTTTPEFGWKGVTDSPLSGVTRNPWNLEMTPGGSSGGAGAALAAGIGHVSLGTDAGGSVRIPGALCGLVAVKATCGRVPNYPPSAAGTLGHVGPITRTVTDAAAMLNVIGVPDGRDWLCLPPAGVDYRSNLGNGVRGMRIAFSPNLGYAKVEPEVAGLVSRAVATFSELGAHVEEVERPFEDPTDVFRVHFFAGIGHAVSGLTDAQRALLDPGLSAVLERASRVTLGDYMRAVDRRGALGRTMRAFHQKYDLLVTPTLAVAAFPVGRIAPEGYGHEWVDWTPFTYPFNLTGQPACTVPCGLTAAGLPVGIQFVGAMYEDATVLRAASAYENARPFRAHPDF